MKKILAVLLLSSAQHLCKAQFSRYIIRLTDKNNSPYSVAAPRQYLSQRAIDRRSRYNIPITDSDLPVNPAYLDSISAAGDVTVLNTSKWFNQVCIRTTDSAALDRITALSFVSAATPVAQRPVSGSGHRPFDSSVLTPLQNRPARPDAYYDYGQAYAQIHLHNAEFLHDHGFRGQGMQLAIMDAGFSNYRTLPTFDSIRNNGQVLDTWDFVNNRSDVNDYAAHGMNCFSTIAANLPGQMTGTAPQAGYYLYRTEDVSSEYPVEEQNFAAAAERADSAGADLFSVSLGYNLFDDSRFSYSYADMNGTTTLSARTVNMAFEKGIIVVVAAGNEGNNTWHYLTTPGDAREALTVGAVNVLRQPGSFSSYGPGSSGQIKPDVAAVGVATVIANPVTGLPSNGNGTSFACPVMAGIASCLWQAFPEFSNADIRAALRLSGDHVSSPDDRTGYGIPDAKKAFVSLIRKGFSSEAGIDGDCQATLQWRVKTAGDMRIIVERKTAAGDFISIDTQQRNTDLVYGEFSTGDDLSALAAGTNVQYRLKMSIGADTSFYLDTVSLQLAQGCATARRIRIAPNPVITTLHISVENYGSVRAGITVHSASGRLVYRVDNQLINNTQTFAVAAQRWNSGVYYASVWIDGKKEVTKRLVKE